MKPYVHALGHEHEAGHPVLVGAEPLDVLVIPQAERDHGRVPLADEPCPGFLLDEVEAAQEPYVEFGQEIAPVLADVLELFEEGMRRGPQRRQEQVEERLAEGPEGCYAPEEFVDERDDVEVRRFLPERGVVEEFVVVRQCSVLVGDVEQQHLLHGDEPV